ncbi:hypothetical protein FHT86_002136 [Rhizobium sp. BK313]|uniref:hypothetical protein n=1 Tax=Rhizobium sp. BK313 TaxID=2587081 RepID=UPI00161F3625|nr:hypothetical protein [Rhizobium sp. BK313]MBB3453880.1 hypothetical protein [Rhizobium sp. BK313]
MAENRIKISDQDLAAMMATQTAIMARLCDLLISKNVMTRAEIANDLHKLLSHGLVEAPRGMGPLKHLLALIDK